MCHRWRRSWPPGQQVLRKSDMAAGSRAMDGLDPFGADGWIGIVRCSRGLRLPGEEVLCNGHVTEACGEVEHLVPRMVVGPLRDAQEADFGAAPRPPLVGDLLKMIHVRLFWGATLGKKTKQCQTPYTFTYLICACHKRNASKFRPF